MLFGRPPFETRDVKVTYRKIKSNNYSFPHHIQVSEDSKDFIRSLLKTDPSKRLPLSEISSHPFLTSYPPLMPPSTLSCPPSTSFLSKYTPKLPSDAPKPGCSPCKVPLAKDIATFECDLVGENDDAQILSTRQNSVQSHRRMESQDKFLKFSRNKQVVSNERELGGLTERGYTGKTVRIGMKGQNSPYSSPKRGANYLQINLAK